MFEELMDYLGRSPIMESCPPVLIAYLGILTSLAADHRGAEAVHGQLAHSGAMYAMLSWSRLFDIMKTYCLRYSQEASEVGQMCAWRCLNSCVPVVHCFVPACYLRMPPTDQWVGCKRLSLPRVKFGWMC